MLIDKPRFVVHESWDNSGDMEVYFHDYLTPDLNDRIARELEGIVPYMRQDERSTFHLEQVINGVFSTMMVGGNLYKKENRRWGWTKEG